MRIYLVGYMYSGKSTVGRQLTEQLNKLGFSCSFIDTDQAFEEHYKISIARCIEKYGHEAFRKLETAILQNIDNKTDHIQIISTGGGTPCYNGNMEYMNLNGLTIYLTVDFDILVQRMRCSHKSRPLLANMPIEERITYMKGQLEERKSYYTTAKLTYNASHPNIPDLCNILIKHIV